VSSDPDRGPSARRPRAVCEVDRAFWELFGHARAGTTGGSGVCSPEAPEPRDFPAPPAGGTKYTLCNGHLRDVFEEQAHIRTPAVPPPTVSSA
jgi:hypothetical protein